MAALVLSGCSGSVASEPAVSPSSPAPSPSTTEEAVTLGPGSFTFETPSGATGTLEVPGAPDAGIESMRVEVGAPEVTYLTGSFDNRGGTEEFLVNSVTVYDAEGVAYEYERAKDYVFDLLPATDNPRYDEYVTFYESVGSSKVAPLERADFVLVGPDLPAGIAGVNVSDGYEMYGAAPL